MPDSFHDERSWIDSLKISPRHLKNKAHIAWNGYDDPRPPFDFPNGPLRRGFCRIFIRLIEESRQCAERRKYRFVGICGNNGKIRCESKRYCISKYCARLFLVY